MNLNNLWVEFHCPKCNYLVDVQLVDFKTKITVSCHNCKTSIRLQDSDATTHNSISQINSLMDDLDQTLKNIFK